MPVLERVMLEHVQQAVQVREASASNGRACDHPPRLRTQHGGHLTHLEWQIATSSSACQSLLYL